MCVFVCVCVCVYVCVCVCVCVKESLNYLSRTLNTPIPNRSKLVNAQISLRYYIQNITYKICKNNNNIFYNNLR